MNQPATSENCLQPAYPLFDRLARWKRLDGQIFEWDLEDIGWNP